MLNDSTYSWNEVLLSARAFWQIRERGSMDSIAGVRMLDIGSAYAQLDTNDRRALFLGVWLEREPIPTGVIAKMRHYLNGDKT